MKGHEDSNLDRPSVRDTAQEANTARSIEGILWAMDKVP